MKPVIVVEKFRPATHISAKDSQMSKAISLFKDPSMKTYVESFRASFCSQLLEMRVENVGDVEIGTMAMPTLKEVEEPSTQDTTLTERICNAGVLRANDMD